MKDKIWMVYSRAGSLIIAGISGNAGNFGFIWAFIWNRSNEKNLFSV